jgi:hypothetical protein
MVKGKKKSFFKKSSFEGDGNNPRSLVLKEGILDGIL